MSKATIKVENLSKIYRLGEIGTGTISRDIERWFKMKVLKKGDPFLKIGETNDRVNKGESDVVYSLQDINFEIKQGDAVGIIGRNGAGKSTLLKILSRVTTPTIGKINIKGRVASLLEVGTGFHPELTGRENIYLNGAILGMRKREIDRKLDEIIDFSGVERYIDTPVKRYSSGMYVRMAFAVAANLESEILIVDEVLAVGDAEFQKKCLGKMSEVSKGEGRTVLFVSHNIGAIKALCNEAILLKNGRLEMVGATGTVIDGYLSVGKIEKVDVYTNENPKPDSDILEIKIIDVNGNICRNFAFEEEIEITFKLKIANKHINSMFGIRVKDQLERNIFTSEISIKDFHDGNEILGLSIKIPRKFLVPNKYTLIVGLHMVNTELISYLENPVQFIIEETGTKFFQYSGNDYGCVYVECNWKKHGL
jgi:lipopolysaccharide transport system ATP-binding protein